MDCPHCQSTSVSSLQRKTSLGYDMYRCKECRRTFNERTDTLFNFIEVPTDIMWEERFLPHFTEQIRAKRQGKVGKVWMVDETYIRLKGVWCYLDLAL